MDQLEQQLRHVLSRGWDPTPGLVDLERVHLGARRRRRRHVVLSAAAAALVVATTALVTAPLVDGPTGTAADDPTVTAEPAPTTATPGEPGVVAATGPLAPQSVTAVSGSIFWVLGQGRCADGGDAGTRCLGLRATADGGRRSTDVGLPPSVVRRAGSVVAQVRFASERDGWLFGDDLFATHDGGRTWRRVALPGEARLLAASGPVVWSVVSTGAGSELMTASTRGDDWRRAGPLPGGGVYDLQARPGEALVLAGSGDLLRVAPDGSTLSRTDGPCFPDLDGQLSVSEDSVWVACATGTQGSVFTSADGVHFDAVAIPPASSTLRVPPAPGSQPCRGRGCTPWRQGRLRDAPWSTAPTSPSSASPPPTWATRSPAARSACCCGPPTAAPRGTR